MPVIEQSGGMGTRHSAVRRHHHAFAGRQTVVFDHPGRVAGRRPEPVQGGIQTCWTVNNFTGSGSNTSRRHDFLGKCFGTLDAGRVLAGPKTDNPGGAHGVGHPKHQRHLRADDDQVGGNVPSQGDDVLTGADVDVMLLGDPAGAGITRSDD